MNYFAYGSNMDLKRLEDLEIHFKDMSAGRIKGWKLVFNVLDNKEKGTGYANIVPDPKGEVEGLIIDTDRESIKKLDWCEDYPDYYKKKKVIAINSDSKKVKCMTYIGNKKKITEGLFPNKIYMKHILKGKMFLDKAYFKHLRRLKTK